MTSREAVAICLLGFVLAGCEAPQPEAVVVVRGGPSLLGVFEVVGKAFESQHPDIRILSEFTCPLCALPALQTGVTRVDVLVAVGDHDINRLAVSGALDLGEVATFGSARLALAVPKQQHADIRGLGDLLIPEVRKVGIADPEHTDLGYYTVRAMQKAGIYAELPEKLVIAKSGCALLKSLALGMYDAAIVYDFCVAQDRSSARQVEVLSTLLYDPIPMRIVANRKSEVAAQAQQFVDFVIGDAAPILVSNGVGLPEDD